jgi:hypothetical protein
MADAQYRRLVEMAADDLQRQRQPAVVETGSPSTGAGSGQVGSRIASNPAIAASVVSTSISRRRIACTMSEARNIWVLLLHVEIALAHDLQPVRVLDDQIAGEIDANASCI